jgi:hypothetical protein
VSDKPRKRKRIWVQHVAVDAQVLRTRVDVAMAHRRTPEREALARGIEVLLDRAHKAAERRDPIPSRLANWWRGTLVEAAYRNLHAARAQVVDLYDEGELDAEIPSAVARAQTGLHREDPRQATLAELTRLPTERRRARVRRLVEDGYESLDRQHEQLRSFRNILFICAVLIAVLVGITVAGVSSRPTVMPLCFPNEIVQSQGNGGDTTVTTARRFNCPTGSNVQGPRSADIVVVALLGLLGGALAAAVSIRNLRGTSTPYDVPVALATLKVPLGAFTAIVGLVAIQGDFIPGLSVLDSQEQILAYALLLGVGQQVFTRLLDRRAQDLLNGIPGKDATEAPPAAPPGHEPIAPVPVPVPVPTPRTDADRAAEAEDQPGPGDEEQEELLPNPVDTGEDPVQDDDLTGVLPAAPELDER